jgi:hypothetical protein
MGRTCGQPPLLVSRPRRLEIALGGITETAAVNVDCEAHLREARRGHSRPEWPGGKRFDIFSRPLAIGRPK